MKIITRLLFLFLCIEAAFAKTVSFTGHPDYSPVIKFDEKVGRFKGDGVLLLTKALEEMGYQVKQVPSGAWARAQEQVKNGSVDILIPPYKTPERESWMQFSSEPFMNDESAIFINKSNKNLKISSVKDLAKYRGAAIINDSFGAEFDKLDESLLKMARLSSTESCFRMLEKNRVDYVIAGLFAGRKVLADIGLKSVIDEHPVRAVVTGMYVGVSKKSPLAKDMDFISKLDAKMREIKARESGGSRRP